MGANHDASVPYRASGRVIAKRSTGTYQFLVYRSIQCIQWSVLCLARFICPFDFTEIERRVTMVLRSDVQSNP